MRAITIKQPWATAIAVGAKHVENRVNPHPWRSAIGQQIAIHAGLGWDKTGLTKPYLLLADQLAQLFAPGDVSRRTMLCVPQGHRRGMLLALTTLTDVHQATPDCGCNPDWAQTDCWHLVLGKTTPFEPIPCKGALGLWTVPTDVHDRIPVSARACPPPAPHSPAQEAHTP